MSTYIVLGNFTDQGVRGIKDTVKRAEGFKALAKQHGATVREIYWTLGSIDVVAIIEAPDAESVAALGIASSALGNVRGQTLCAFSAAEMAKVIDKMK